MVTMRSLVVMAFVTMGALIASTPNVSEAGLFHRCACVECCKPCPPPPPVKQEICIKDPCTCCTYKVCVCIPACCEGEPCVTWRNGFFGRRIATLTWKNCGHCVDVVITRHGRIIVRG